MVKVLYDNKTVFKKWTKKYGQRLLIFEKVLQLGKQRPNRQNQRMTGQERQREQKKTYKVIFTSYSQKYRRKIVSIQQSQDVIKQQKGALKN